MAAKTQITTGKVRFSYVSVFRPKLMRDGTTEKYSVTLLIPKRDKQTLRKIEGAIEAARNLSSRGIRERGSRRMRRQRSTTETA